MLRLSSRQFAMLRKMPKEFNRELAQRYNQTSLGSLAQRGYVKKRGGAFHLTDQGQDALSSFGHDQVFRKNPQARISLHFREVLDIKKRSA